MKSFVISIVVLFTVAITVADAIKCYVCIGEESDCTKDKLEADKAKYLLNCTESADTCRRYWTKNAEGRTTVINSCTNKTQCDGSKKACDEEWSGQDGRQCTISCCQTDECNAGSAGSPTVAIKCTNDASTSLSFSVFLMTVSSVLGLVLLNQA